MRSFHSLEDCPEQTLYVLEGKGLKSVAEALGIPPEPPVSISSSSGAGPFFPVMDF